jgi:hypothetical protein
MIGANDVSFSSFREELSNPRGNERDVKLKDGITGDVKV